MSGTAAMRTRLEDAVVNLLAPLRARDGIRQIKPYAGEMDVEGPEDVMKALRGNTPGILVTTGSATYKGFDVARRTYRSDVEVTLFLISAVQSTREDRRRGDNQIYEMLDAVTARLAGARPDLGAGVDAATGRLEPMRESEFDSIAQLTIWRQDWIVSVAATFEELPGVEVAEVAGNVRVAGDEAGVAVGASQLIT